MFPESHGIMGNYMYDKERGDFIMDDILTAKDNTNNPWWWRHHVPIWTHSHRGWQVTFVLSTFSFVENGKLSGKRSSVYYFSRCDVPFNGDVVPEKCFHYDNVNVLNGSLFHNNLRSAFQDLEQGFDFSIIYYCNIDNIGHLQGPDSEEIGKEIEKVDSMLGEFISSIRESEIGDNTNVIIVSDHGT